jgi:hypothetical protein
VHDIGDGAQKPERLGRSGFFMQNFIIKLNFNAKIYKENSKERED